MVKIRKLIKSFQYALAGLEKVFWEEQNFRVHSFIAALVLLLAVYLKIEVWEFTILIIVIAMILILEIANSIFERLLDLIKPRLHSYVKDIKDMTAALVLVAAVAAVIVGILIFLPYLINYLNKF